MIATVLRRRAAPLALFALAAIVAAPARAGDRPASPEGVATLQAFFDRFLPTPAPGAAPMVSVKANAQSYQVTIDVAALNGLMTGPNGAASYASSPHVVDLFEQDDGNWRVVESSFPKTVSRNADVTSTVEVDGYHQTLVVNPSLAWFVGGDAGATGGRVRIEGAKIREAIDFGALRGDYATTVNADGSVSSTIKQDIADIAFAVAPGGDAPGNGTSGRLDKASFNVGVDGLWSRKLMDLVSFVSVHRADLAAHEAEVKTLLRPLAAPGLRFVEGGEASKLMLATPMGAVALSAAKIAVGVSNAGPDSALDTTFAAEGLSLPPGLLPPNAADLTPSKVDLALTLKGIDIAAAATQAIDNLHFGGPGPAIAETDSTKVSAALLGAGPLKVVIAPSHVVAPAIDGDVQGELRYAAGKTSGAVTLKMRNFDKTMTAIRALGPEIAAKSLPMVAMAKGLAKTESDGALSWLIEVGEERSIRVNGIPLGKMPE